MIRKVRVWFHHWLAVAFEGHHDELALRHVRALALLGDQWGVLELGVRYQNGETLGRCYEKAFCCYKKAASIPGKYSGIAKYNVGTCFLRGIGTNEDSVEASNWFKKAAGHGHLEAQYNYGLALIDGWGNTQDTEAGILLLEKAASRGLAQARESLATLSRQGPNDGS